MRRKLDVLIVAVVAFLHIQTQVIEPLLAVVFRSAVDITDEQEELSHCQVERDDGGPSAALGHAVSASIICERTHTHP